VHIWRFTHLAGLTIAAVLAVASTTCSSQTCTLIGCVEQFSATITGPGGSFPTGAHRIEVTADGASLTCTFAFPGAGANDAVTPACSPGLEVTVGPAQLCTEMRMGDSVTLRCEPIPGQFEERLTVRGTPAQLRVVQTVDGGPILEQETAPAYQTVWPNGPECGGACRQATATWTLSAGSLARP
jgi:hypothetical protein